jgi:glycosyltransferase involved in cell wall biosynthesis
MKILHLAIYEGTGAGRAAFRLHQGLLQEKVNSSMLVLEKGVDDKTVLEFDKQTLFLKRLQAKLLGRTLSEVLAADRIFSINATPSLMLDRIRQFNASIINLHWVGWEYVRIEDINKFKNPLVWTLQDMWPFTGGCHYSHKCDRYANSCGACPQLQSHKESDLSRWVWQRKVKAWQNLNLTIVAPSKWMAECASASSLFQDLRVEVIPFCLDTEQYRPIPQQEARQLLNLPKNKKLVLFGAINATEDTRKGFHLLIPALQKLSQSAWKERIELVIFGSSPPEKPIDLGFKTHYLGHLNDEISLVNAYSAVDVMIVPSLQESFGQTASESLACGTPVVAFNATGLKDIVDHQENGYLVKPYEIEDLVKGIVWVLEDRDRHQKLCIHAREKAKREFALEIQARLYSSLYTEITEKIERKMQKV